MYEHIIAAAARAPWAIDPESREWRAIQSVLSLRTRGIRPSDEEIRARIDEVRAAQGPRRGRQVLGSVAVIPIYGTIMPRANLMTEYSGGTTVQGIRAAFREALADESIGAILFDVDSPGGFVDGIDELAAEIRAARGQKPMVAISDTTMASAAYYLGAQADEVVASPSSLTGSIGIFTEYVDESRADEMAGLDVEIIKAGRYKAETVYGPLTDDARAHLQERIDDYYAQFVTAVAKGRGVSPAAVRAGYGEGRALTAQRALEAGLVDRVDSFDGAVRRLATGKVAPRGASAIEPLDDVALDRLTAELVSEGTGEAMEGIEAPADGSMSEPIGEPDPRAELELATARARMHARR